MRDIERPGARFLVALIGVALAGAPGCTRVGVFSAERVAPDAAAFAGMQARGRQAMGVDQYTSTHVFDVLPDGGRIELQRDVDDPAGVAQIREHLRKIALAFAAGDFSTPALVHMQSVPGTSVMAAQRAAITYSYGDVPRGGAVRIVTQDAQALQAIHEFLSFQRQEHRAGGSERGHHGGMHDGSREYSGHHDRTATHRGRHGGGR